MSIVKKIVFYIAITAFFFAPVVSLYAQVEDLEPLSAVAPTGGVPDLSFGVPDYQDSVFSVGFLYSSNDFVLSSTTPFTILSFSVVWARFAVEDYATILCDDVDISNGYFALADSNFGLTSFAPLHCFDFRNVASDDESASALGYAVQYVSYDTRKLPNVVNYRDWLFVSMVMIFLLAFVPIGLLYSIVRPKK